jgi:hypothetical protein
MNGLFLFVVSCLIGGAAAVLGSILGNAAGTTGLFGGAILGGLAGAVASTALARRFQWIRPEAARSTAAGTAIGFLAAAAVATQTLGSPVGPVLSTGLIGVGALLGARMRHRG